MKYKIKRKQDMLSMYGLFLFYKIKKWLVILELDIVSLKIIKNKMVKFTKKQINSLTLGEQLKQIRNEGRITLSEVVRETKIPAKYLEMIEEGKYESLPPDVYVRGFLRKYGEFLGLDVNKMIKMYYKEKEIRKRIEQIPDREEKIIDGVKVPRRVFTPKIIVIAIIFLAVSAGLYYLYQAIEKFASTPLLAIKTPISNQDVSNESIEVSGLTDKDAVLTINEQPVPVDDKGEFKVNITLKPGINTIDIKAKNRFEKIAEETINVRYSENNSEFALQNQEEFNSTGQDVNNEQGVVSGEQDQKNSSEKVVLQVRVIDVPTWIKIDADGNTIFSGIIMPDESQSFEADQEIKLTSGKGEKTFVRVNGSEEKQLGNNPGVVRDVSFKKQ